MNLSVEVLTIVLTALVVLGAVPTAASLLQFLLVGLHARRDHYDRCGDYTPRVAIVVPAWNEGNVIGNSIDMLVAMDYPADCLKVFVVDDASTDHTPEVVLAKAQEHPGQVVHLRREKGGQGKAHTLNHGLRSVLEDGWAEAVLIMDADVLFEPLTLRRMARHLADPRVGAVTGYIKEGSAPGNLVSRYIAFEYITAQAAARRAQNVLGSLACLAGGAQLHSRQNLEAIGGLIDTSTLAEDTVTTFRTQLAGRRAIFDGNAVVWAEEPGTVEALWKQRLRWARGNLQLTAAFRGLWFRGRRLASPVFGLIWFSIVSMPVLMIGAAVGLVGLYLLDPPAAWAALSGFWGLSVLVHLFVTFYSFAIDPGTARRAWFEGLTFPGLVSLGIMALALLPEGRTFGRGADGLRGGLDATDIAMLLVYAWTGLSMLPAWALYRLEKAGLPARLRDALLLVIGYGPLLCAITLASYISEYRKAGLQWDKTEKTGKARMLQ